MNKLNSIYQFLNPKDKLKKSDLIIGFGHFDMRIPEQCVQLYKKGYAPYVVFTGGVGAGSADFKQPEANEFLDYVQQNHPDIDTAEFILESESTNTGENILNTIEILTRKGIFDSIKTIIIVATPTRQLRASLTVKKHLPDIQLINCSPNSSYEFDERMNENNKIDFEKHLLGELERIISYPKLGFACEANIPKEILTISSKK